MISNAQRRRLFKKNAAKNTDPEEYVEGKEYPGRRNTDPYGYQGNCPRCGAPVEPFHCEMVHSDEHRYVYRCPKYKRLFAR